MIQAEPALIKKLAHKYIWWKTLDEAITMPERIIAQVMDIGDYEDIQLLVNNVGDETLRDVLTHAEIGQFNPRSWAYWHYRLGLAPPEQLPELPRRKLP